MHVSRKHHKLLPFAVARPSSAGADDVAVTRKFMSNCTHKLVLTMTHCEVIRDWRYLYDMK